MAPPTTSSAPGGMFHTFQGVVPRKQQAATPSTSSKSRDPGSKRITTSHACAECKRRKIRCDGKQPCGQCISSRAPKRCFYDKHRQRFIPSRKTLDALTQSLEECRSVLRRLYPDYEVADLLPLSHQELLDLLEQARFEPPSALPSPPLDSGSYSQGLSSPVHPDFTQSPFSMDTNLGTMMGDVDLDVLPEHFESADLANSFTQRDDWALEHAHWGSSQNSCWTMEMNEAYPTGFGGLAQRHQDMVCAEASGAHGSHAMNEIPFGMWQTARTSR